MNLMVVSTDKLTDRIVDQLRQSAPQPINIAFHMGRKNADFRASSIRRMRSDRKSPRHMFDRKYLNNLSLKYSEDPNFANSLYNFVDHLNRTNKDHAYQANPIEYIHEAYDYFYLAFDYIAGLMRDYEIDHVLFFQIPHLAYDTICYAVAKALGVETTILSQSLFSNGIFSAPGVESFGRISFSPNYTGRYLIDREERRNLFYMKGIDEQGDVAQFISPYGFLSVMLYVLFREPSILIRPMQLSKLMRRANAVYRLYPKWRDPFGKFFNRSSLEYFETLSGLRTATFDLNQKFVYFPLQLQPEMTTSALGGVFVDQALAIEALAEMLPNDVQIVVKENPKQMGFMRGPMFFHRLARLRNIHVVPEHFDTHVLTRKSVFVATITGTVGWEAVTKGKPALVFGNPWYLSLPGVTRYREGLRYEDVALLEVDHELLERAVSQLLAASHEGVIDRHYTILVPDFEAEANSRSVAAAIIALLRGQRPYTFE